MKKLIPVILIGLLSLPLIFDMGFIKFMKLKTFDTFVPTFEESGYFTVINLDEDFVNAKGGYPIPRQDLAQIHADIINAGALGVGWVLAMPHADRLGGDDIFANVLGQTNSVLSIFEYNNGEFPRTVGTVIHGDNVSGLKIGGTINNIKTLREAAAEGLATAPVDYDNLVRNIPLIYQTPDGWTPSFATEVLKILVGADTYVIKTNELGIEEIRVKGLPPVKTDTLGRKWVSWVKTSETNLEDLDVENKFVFIGFTAAGIMPQIATPDGLLEPHKIQTALAESILIENSPYVPDWNLAAELGIFLIFGALTWLVTHFLGLTYGLVSLVFVLSSTAFGGIALIQKGLLLNTSWTFVSEVLIASVSYYLKFREQYKLRQQIKKQFEHYLDPRQVKQLQDNPGLLKLGGEQRYCTFLFTDVRGFTALSERLSPEEVSKIMNLVLTAQTDAVLKYGGMVDKFIGDAMMAIFNAPIDLVEHEKAAYLAAVEIKTNLEQVNDKLKDMGLPQIAIGQGINTGKAVLGNMGSQSRFDYSAIGDAVNVAARLESGTKAAGVEILIGESTAQKLDFELQSLEPIEAKGKSDKLQVYTWDIN